MKKVVLYAAMSCLIFSCKKSNDDQSPFGPPTPPTLSTTGSITGSVVPGAKTVIGMYQFSVGNMDEFASGMDFAISGTIPLSSIKNFYFTVRKKSDSSMVHISSVKPSVTALSYEYVDLPKNTQYLITAFADILPTSIGQLKTTLQIEYIWRDVSISEWIDEISGQTIAISPYASMPVFTWHELSGAIQDSVEMDLYSYSVTNTSSTERISFPQFTFAVTISDVGANDTLSVFSPKWIVNGIDSTGRVLFTNGSGTPITLIPEGNTKIFVPYVTGRREAGIGPGETYTFTFRGTPAGFHREGNGMSVQLLSDVAIVTPQHVNVATPGSNLKLTLTQSPGSGTVYHLIMGFNARSAIPGASDKAFVNGRGIDPLPVQYFYQP